MTPREFNITEYSKVFTSKIEHYENKNVLFIGFNDIDVISEIINQKYKNCNIYIVDNKETCDCISLLDLKANIYILNSYNEENNYIKEVFGPLNFYDDILVSVWKNGASIATSALKLLKENGTCICSMLMSNYKKKELYRHVETFELANPKLFKDAVITENLCICKVKKCVLDKYSWMDLVLKSVDQRYIEFYKWNIAHNKGLVMRYARDKSLDYFNKDLDFLETARCTKPTGGGFGKNGIGYKWNILHNYSSVNSHIGQITFETAKARNNFATCWYSGDNSRKHLLGKAASGMNIQEVSAEYYFFIPQIDWSNIHINQKELWDKGLYDEAVLAEMHLKWNEDKTKIIQA